MLITVLGRIKLYEVIMRKIDIFQMEPEFILGDLQNL